MPASDDRRGFLRGATLGAIGLAGIAAADAIPFPGDHPSARRAARETTEPAVSRGTQSAVAALNVPSAGVVNVKDLGAVGDGRTDDSAAFAAAARKAGRAARLLPFSMSPDPVGSVVIDIPPGTYVIKKPRAFLGPQSATGKINGIRWRGAGNSITTIVFKPSGPGEMMTNNVWQNLQFEAISFTAGTKDCTFFLSDTTRNAQRYFFLNCSWSNFRYGFSLKGDNNNSEFVFVDCHSSGFQDNGVFFSIGTADTSDQFVNYWFYGFTHWSTAAPFIDAAKGGQFQIYGLDASDWGSRLTKPGYLIRLRGAAHGLGVCQLVAHGVRVEAKSRFAGLLRSEWPQGQVSFNNVDWTSQTGSQRYGDIVRIDYANTAGPIYSFNDCALAGGVLVNFSINDWEYDHRIVFTNCSWLQRSSPTDVVRYHGPSGANYLAKPAVRFSGCRGGSGNPLSPTGSNIWDATVGYRGQLSQSLEARTVSLRSTNGTPGSGRLMVNLPVGATVTAFEVMSPAGGVATNARPRWTLAASNSPGRAIAAITSNRPAAKGYRVRRELDPPFECRTAASARLIVRAAGGQDSANALILIHGYW